MAKKRIVSQYNDDNVVLVLPKGEILTQHPETIHVLFDCNVRDVSLTSNLSTTTIPKELITIDTVSVSQYGHYLYDTDKFPNSLTDTLYEGVSSGSSILADISGRPVLALTMLAGFASGISAFITGLIAIIKQKDRAILVYVSSIFFE